MARTLPYDVQDSTKSLLLRNTLLCSIKKMYPTVGMATLSKMVWNGNLDGPRGAQKYLRSINISISLSDAEKLLNGIKFKAKRKNKTNFVSAANKKLRLAWVRKHRQLTVSDWLDPSIGQMCLVPTDLIKFSPKCKVVVMGLCFEAAYQTTDLAMVLQLLMGRLIQTNMWKF
ncbi:hypothetical protein INT46_007142 [Mucor plumbeus]|uniref:Transposase Tc1-like domain-containing protein n=1 Tax=Mucor plumbeus TaxID=97098 RepID=A0A8H7R197_9FUNG|nr:hypothetical protein INT46_007142 [Mucor plumbeus]